MPLTPAQLMTLKSHINASGDLNVFPNTSDGAFEIQKLLTLNASPAFTVWKTLVSIGQVGRSFSATELAGLTANNLSRLQTLALYLAAGVNPSLADVRAFFDDVFGAGGAVTRASLLVLWKRLANRAEQLYATGTGSDASPGTLVFEGVPTLNEIMAARNLP